MAYCTVADIRARHGNRMPSTYTDTVGKGSDDKNIHVMAAIDDATQIIHQIVPYVAVSDFVPTATLMATLKTVAVDIAIYRMVDGTKIQRTEEMSVHLPDVENTNVQFMKGRLL